MVPFLFFDPSSRSACVRFLLCSRTRKGVNVHVRLSDFIRVCGLWWKHPQGMHSSIGMLCHSSPSSCFSSSSTPTSSSFPPWLLCSSTKSKHSFGFINFVFNSRRGRLRQRNEVRAVGSYTWDRYFCSKSWEEIKK